MARPDADHHIKQASAEHNPFEGAPTFSLRHRLLRLAWRAVWLALAAWTPPPLHRWRIFLANLFGAKVHPTAAIYGSARIWFPPNLTMAARSALGRRVDCYCMAPISLGEQVVVSQGASLCSGTHDIHDESFQTRARPITIGDRAWICAEAFVGPGVSVGEGAVLGARGVAFRDLDPWTVYVGNPAVEKGSRSRP